MESSGQRQLHSHSVEVRARQEHVARIDHVHQWRLHLPVLSCRCSARPGSAVHQRTRRGHKDFINDTQLRCRMGRMHGLARCADRRRADEPMMLLSIRRLVEACDAGYRYRRLQLGIGVGDSNGLRIQPGNELRIRPRRQGDHVSFGRRHCAMEFVWNVCARLLCFQLMLLSIRGLENNGRWTRCWPELVRRKRKSGGGGVVHQHHDATNLRNRASWRQRSGIFRQRDFGSLCRSVGRIRGDRSCWPNLYDTKRHFNVVRAALTLLSIRRLGATA